jgi:hypothetical protein
MEAVIIYAGSQNQKDDHRYGKYDKYIVLFFLHNSKPLTTIIVSNNAAAALLFIRGKHASFITHIKQKRRDG